MSHFSGLTVFQKTYEYVEPPLREHGFNSAIISKVCRLSTPIFLKELLPYNSCTRVEAKFKIEGFKEYDLLLKIVKLAINALLNKNFLEFDPLVGDNACQIRAYQIALIINECLNKVHLLEEQIDKALATLVKIINDSKKLSALCNNKNSFDDLLQKLDLDIELSYEEFFLIQSHVLTLVKTILPYKITKSEKTDPRKLQQLGEVSFKFANNLSNLARHQLTQESVSIVRSVAYDLFEKDHKYNQLVKMTSREFTIYHRDLPCLSIFWFTLTLMTQALKKKIPIILWGEQVAIDKDYKVINETFVFFESDGQKYQEKVPSSHDLNCMAIVMQGSSCRNKDDFPDAITWKKELIASTPPELFLACTALHRQFPDSSKNSLITDLKSPLLASYAEKGKEWGCHLGKPTLFFTTHVFCTNVGFFRWEKSFLLDYLPLNISNLILEYNY